jgi:uncharacterized protein YjbJ (UPF0337 family)
MSGAVIRVFNRQITYLVTAKRKINMNTNKIEKNWTEVKSKIKTTWNKFSDEQIDSLKDDLTQLSGKIQKVYGVAKDNADHQFDEFKKSVHTLISDDHATSSELKVNITVEKTAPAKIKNS